MGQDVLVQNLVGILEIIWLNVVLSGDNAVVIALACRGLPPDVRRTGMILGAGAAVLLRVIFTVIVVALLGTPFLRIAGALMLLWIAVHLLVEDDEDDTIAAKTKLWSAVRTVVVADMVMSLDNVLAVAAVAKDSTVLLVLGLLISIPLIVAGASLMVRILNRFPILVWAGALLLGWVAGEMLASDPFLEGRFGEAEMERLHYPAAAAGAAIVLAGGLIVRRLAKRKTA